MRIWTILRQLARRLHLPRPVREVGRRGLTIIAIPLTYIRLFANRHTCNRRLQIGPGSTGIRGFETLDIRAGEPVDYVLDASKPLPFRNDTFDLIHASHILEHIPWYQTEDVLHEWVRILKPGGRLELWVPDGLKICETLIEAETTGIDRTHLDGWYKFNARRDPCVWAAGRLFTYGDGAGRIGGPNWHRALFTERYLRDVLKRVGLLEVTRMNLEEVRGYNHGWINLGVRGTKPFDS